MTRSVISGANLNPPVDTSTLAPTSFRLPTATSLPSSPASGQLYYDTSAGETRVWDSNWKKLDTALALEATQLAFSSASNFTTGSWTGQDGITRANGRLTSPTLSYSGASLSTRLDADYQHVLVLRYLANGDPYVGLGWTQAPIITDAQASVAPSQGHGQYYGHHLPPHGAASSTTYGMYFNQASGSPSRSQVGYFYFYTDGSGSGRTFNIRWSSSYSLDYKNVGAPAGGGSTNNEPWSNSATIGSNDIAIWLGEASNTNEWRIERYSRSI